MGLSDFFNNFACGTAFGLLVNNPLLNRMNSCRCSCSFPMTGMGASGMQFNSLFDESFANSFPKIDFSGVKESLWNDIMNQDSDFNKSFNAYYDKLNNSAAISSTNLSPKIPQFDMPFSSFYLPTQYSYGGGIMPFSSLQQYQVTTKKEDTSAKETDSKKTDKVTSKKTKVSDEPEETDSDILSKGSGSCDVSALKAKWSKKKELSDEFYAKVISISKKINCNPNDLMGVMWVETTHTFSPSIKHPGGSATGLIQFTKSTAEVLGTSIDELKAMTQLQQLEYVEKYLILNKKDAGYRTNEYLDRGALYSLVFLPGRSKRTVLTRKGEDYYSKNKVLDYDKDGVITKADLSSVVKEHMA